MLYDDCWGSPEVFKQQFIKFNHNKFLSIINHTMLQNSATQSQSELLSKVTGSSAQFMFLHSLLREVEQHKHSLSQALAINSLLVHEASACRAGANTTEECSQEGLAVVKMEECGDSGCVSVEIQGRRGGKRKEGEGQEGHDKNETKNIPKNYGKAILSFIQKNIHKYLGIIKPILNRSKLSISDLLLHIKRHKKEVNSINYLKEMWGYQDRQNPILKCIRILSYVFMRKHCLSYIFNSRVKNYSTHIKYRTRIIEGIQHPEEFTCIKQF